ncbi:putative Lipid A biosynthesis acyltransferase [Candidatus Zixiibacteriota bacterium]|nr:putative Lipid A biosynthesis acyltransferase [candidate division Zixibacteria bacterium]
MTISHGLEYLGVRLLTGLVQILPARVADWKAILLGNLAYYILTSRRRIARANLKRAFPGEKDDREITRIVKGVFVNIARTSVEFARQPKLKRDRILDMVTCEGKEHLDRVVKEGKGAMLISGHFGNWELLGAWLAAVGYNVDFLVGEQHNPYVDRLLVSFREAVGVGIIPVGVASRHVFKALRVGRMVAVVSDQHSASGGEIVQFFGRPASTPKGPAAFAVKVGCPILCGGLVRLGYNRHHAIITPPIYPPATGNDEQDIHRMTQEYTSRFEAIIREHPEQWMWTHRRWKVD